MLAGAPAGSGKSLAAHTIGRMSGVKYAILTATRTLEDQNVADGFDCVNVRGKANYDCQEFLDTNCDEGPEKEPKGCKLSGTANCTYGGWVQLATNHNALITNYQYWMNVRAFNGKALEKEDNPIGLLICDEFHLAFNELARFLGTWVPVSDMNRYGEDYYREALKNSGGKEWGRLDSSWLNVVYMVWAGITTRMLKIAEFYKAGEAEAAKRDPEYKRLMKMGSALDRITAHADDNNWIWKRSFNGHQSGIEFACVWPNRYAERYLYCKVPRVIGLSATNRPKTAILTGVPRGESHFREWGRIFPAKNNPVVWIPTGRAAKIIGERADPEEQRKAKDRANEIYDEWAPNHKGLVCTPSYKLAYWLRDNTRWGKYMMINERGEAGEMAERFRQAKPPAILVSPSYGTGWDFKGEQCEWIHVPKLPFPDKSDPVIQARCEMDEEYYAYETAQPFQQECGRGTRSPECTCTVMVTDDAVKNFRNYARVHMSGWFKVGESSKRVNGVTVGVVPRAPGRGL